MRLRISKATDNFNPRSPHGERHAAEGIYTHDDDFNPRSPHGERPLVERLKIRLNQISTHAPRTGSDSAHGRGATVTAFQPTLPARGATHLRSLPSDRI